MSFGFKEWTLICDALGRGEQSIIIRKGGIAEGRAGFRFEHPEFLLFSTLFHEQVAKLKLPPATPLPAPRADGQHEVRLRVRVAGGCHGRRVAATVCAAAARAIRRSGAR